MAAIQETGVSILSPQRSNDGNIFPGSIDLNSTIPDGIKEAEEASKVFGSQLPVLKKTRSEIIISRVQLFAVCFSLFNVGWNDGSNGPMLPRLREVYDASYTIVSLIFVMASLGYIFGAFINFWATDKLGFGKVMIVGAALQIIAYSVQISTPPFAVFVVFSVLNGSGVAVQVAQTNGFVGAMKSESKMGILHASYGLGAFSSPFVATQFAQMHRWSFHYLTSLGLSLSNALLLLIVFRGKDQTGCLIKGGERVDAVPGGNDSGKFRQMITSKTVHTMAFFILVYVGVEVTLGGWIVTYIINVRDGGPSSGYISAGFFGGLALGRVALLPVNKWVGERRVLFIYAGLALGLDFVIWFVPSLIGDAIAVSIIGLLLGPMFPIAMNQSARILPPWILTGSIGWIAGFGQAGSALFPFIAGAVAQNHGIKTLHPMLVSMMVLMIILFWMTPTHRPHEAEPAEAEKKPSPA